MVQVTRRKETKRQNKGVRLTKRKMMTAEDGDNAKDYDANDYNVNDSDNREKQ